MWKGIVITAVYVLIRLVGVRLWESLFGSVDLEVSVKFIIFLFMLFLVISVGLIYFGFTKWMGIDLRKWWFNRKRLWGDIGWGCGGLVVLGLIFIASAVAVFVLLGLRPEGFEEQQGRVPPLHLIPVWILLHLFFGFATEAFQEETVFRGFW